MTTVGMMAAMIVPIKTMIDDEETILMTKGMTIMTVTTITALMMMLAIMRRMTMKKDDTHSHRNNSNYDNDKDAVLPL